MVDSTRLAHALPNIDVVQTLCISADMPTNQVFFHDFDAVFRHATKPSFINELERPFSVRLLEMTAAASGGDDELRQRPSVLGIITPVAPLRLTTLNKGLIDAVRAGVPIPCGTGPLTGATGPVTAAGTLALSNADVLLGLVYGGWRGLYCASIEAWTGYPPTLEHAVAQGRFRQLKRGESLEAQTKIVVFSGLVEVTGIKPTGEVMGLES